jgi:hypothetical protein
LNSSGFNDNAGSNFTQGVEVNVANLSSSLTSLDDNWTFSCLANDGTSNSSWLNSSIANVAYSVVECNSCSDCSNKLNSASSGGIVKLNTSLSDLSGDCVVFDGVNNVTFDCEGNSISGDGTGYHDDGLVVYEDSSYFNIQNCVLNGFDRALIIDGADDGFLINITSYDNVQGGLFNARSQSNSVIDCNFSYNSDLGFYINYHANDNVFYDNTFLFNGNSDFSAHDVSGNLFYNNTFRGDSFFGFSSTDNFWNSSSIGNHWLDFDFNTESCFDVDDDGFCDSSYSFQGVVDYLPQFQDSVPTMINTKILPENLTITSQIKGYCNATEQNNVNLSYYYRWYKNGVLNSSGVNNNSGSGFTQGIEVNVANVSSSLTSPLDNWTFSCLASNDYANSSWFNTTKTVINDSPPIINITKPNITWYNTSSDYVFINASIIENNLVNLSFNWTNSTVSLFDTDLVLFMNFNNISELGESNSFVKDISTHENDGDVYGATFTNEGKYMGAYSFDGSDDYIVVDNANFSDALTINLWGKSDIGSPRDMLFSFDGSGSGPDLWFANDNIYWNTGDGYDNPLCAQQSVTSWHYYSLIVQNGNTKLYIDGELCGTATYKNPESNTLYFGRYNSDNNYNWDGLIDDVRVYNKILSEKEIQELYAAELNKINSSSYRLKINKTELSVGNYNYSINAIDSYNQSNNTGLRNITVLMVPLNISSCQNLSVFNKTYYLTNNVSFNGTCFNIVNSSVTLDCLGNFILGNGSDNGIYVYDGSDNFNIQNCVINDFYTGIYVDGAVDGGLINITSYDNVRGAFFDTDSKRNTITDSNFSYNSDNGFRLKDHCDDNVFYNNSFLFNGLYDFFIGYSSSDGNIIYNNTFRNKYFIRTESIDLNFWNSSGVGNRWLGFDSEAEGCFDSNSDGFCDSSYSFGDVVDYFPIFTNSSPSVYECGSCSACNDVLQNYDLVPGDVVKLNTSLSNIDGTCIDFGDNFKNIIFDCDNKVISGDNDSSGSGIYVPDLADYSTIRNCELNDFNVGVYAISEYSVYENITATNNSYSGFYSYHSSFCNFTNLNSSYNAVGFRFRDHSDQNIITNSTFLFNDEYDYYLGYASSDKNIFYNNTLRGEHYLNAQEDLNFWNYSGVGNRWLGFDSEAEGCFDSNSDGFCDSSYSFGDVVDYFPIFTNSSPSVYECGSCSACNDVLQNYDLVPGDVVKLNTSLSNIDGNCINFDTYNRDVIFDCDNNIISGDSDTNGAGIYIDSTDYNHHNTIQNCEFKEFHSGIQTNNHYNNFYNISSHDNSYAGIYLHYGNYNVFDNVILVNNSNGLRFYDFCKYNNITNSFSTNNTNFDFSDRYSGGDNNFYDNVFSSKDYIDTSVDHNWNSSSTGNRWLGYDDKQEGCFDSNSDGFCDSSYTIDASNIDYYPKFYSSIPSILTSNILPDPANSTQELKGYCAATDSHNDNLSYYYRWYKDGILNSSGFNDNSGSGFTQGIEVNVANLSISLTSPLDNWTFSCLGTDNYDNSSWLNHSTIITNHLPTISSVDITPQEPSLEDNLTCSVSGWSDADNDQENYYFQWYKNNSLQFTDYQSETTNVLDSDLTSLNENWTCKVTPNDGYENGSSLNDSVYVRNFPPNKPILLLPENENYSLETRTPNFIWNATDLENDTLTFELKINNSVCSDYLYDSFTPNNSSNTFNYTIPDELCTEFEASNSVYTWQVRSHDGISYSEWSDTYNFSIDDLLLIDMVDDTMNFNSLNPYDEVDSDTNNDPFVIKNVGLVEADLTNLSIASNFWQTANLGTEHLQFKADNYSTQSVFNYSESITDWTNFSSSNLNVIKALDYTKNNNYAEIDLKLIVPGIESVGERQKVINFNWDITNS